MPAADEAVSATVRISAGVVTSTADIAKYILQVTLGVRGQGRATDGVLWRMGGKSMMLDTKVTATLYDVVARPIDGISSSAQGGRKRVMTFNDMTTFSIAAELTDPENLAALRRELRRAGVTFVLTKIGQGDTLIGYHVSQEDVVTSVVTPLLRVWARAVHIDPDSDQELSGALVSHDIAHDLTEAEHIVWMARSEEKMTPVKRPVDQDLVSEATVESNGVSTAVAEAVEILEERRSSMDKAAGNDGNKPLQPRHDGKDVKEGA